MMNYHFGHQNLTSLVCSLTELVSNGWRDNECSSNTTLTDPTFALLPPCDRNPVPAPLIKKIIMCLSTRFDLAVKDIRPHLRIASLMQYGRLRHLDGGDVMNASA